MDTIGKYTHLLAMQLYETMQTMIHDSGTPLCEVGELLVHIMHPIEFSLFDCRCMAGKALKLVCKVLQYHLTFRGETHPISIIHTLTQVCLS